MGQSHGVKHFLLAPIALKMLRRLPREETTWEKGMNYSMDQLMTLCFNTAREFGWCPARFGAVYAVRKRAGAVIAKDTRIKFILFIQPGKLVLPGNTLQLEANNCACVNRNVSFNVQVVDYIVILISAVIYSFSFFPGLTSTIT